jgi:hypothetical protein
MFQIRIPHDSRLFLEPFPGRPAFLLTLLLSPLFLYMLSHHGLLVAPLLLIPLSLFIFLCTYVLIKHLFKSIVSRKLRPALIVSALLAGFIYFLQPHLFIYLILYVVWLFVNFSLGRSGALFTGYAALLIFSLMLIAHRLMLVEEFLFFQARSRLLMLSDTEGEAKLEWERPDPTKNVYRISADGRTVLIMALPEGMHFHAPDQKKPGFNHPEPGFPIAFVSSSEEDPEFEPALSIFELDPRRAYRPTDFLPDFKMFLGYRAGIKEIFDLKYMGALQAEIGGLPAEGIFWSYRVSSREARRIGIYIVKSASGRRHALIVTDVPVEGFPHNPEILYIFKGLLFS